MREGAEVSGQQHPRASAVYDGNPASIAAAREFVATFLTAARNGDGVRVPARTIGTAQLVVSELVTNACKYAPGPCVLDISADATGVEISVWDSEASLPQPRELEPGRIGQHGLEIVLALCDAYDVRREPVGKRISVRLSTEADGPLT